jgi:hypothetical protein
MWNDGGLRGNRGAATIPCDTDAGWRGAVDVETLAAIVENLLVTEGHGSPGLLPAAM